MKKSYSGKKVILWMFSPFIAVGIVGILILLFPMSEGAAVETAQRHFQTWIEENGYSKDDFDHPKISHQADSSFSDVTWAKRDGRFKFSVTCYRPRFKTSMYIHWSGDRGVERVFLKKTALEPRSHLEP
jgi:hypothetical protein